MKLLSSCIIYTLELALLWEFSNSCTVSGRKSIICETCSGVKIDSSQERADSLFNVLNCGYLPFNSFKISSESYVRFDSVFCRRTLLRNGNDSLIVLEPLYPEDFKDQQFSQIRSPDFAGGIDEKMMKEGWEQMVSAGGSPYFSIGFDWTNFYVTQIGNNIILSTTQRGATGFSASYCWNFLFEKTYNNLTVFKPVCEDQRSVLFLR